MIKEVIYGEKCKHFPEIAVSSHRCRQCKYYVSHEMNLDFHGRADTITIECAHEDKSQK